MLRIAVGVVVAVAFALAFSGASFAGVAAWKILLAAFGLVLFIAAGRSSGGTPPAR